MKLFIGGLITETNTFSPLPTGRANYEETALFFGDATKHPSKWASSALLRWREMAEHHGFDVHEGLFAMAQPAGPTVRSVYDEFSGALIDGVAQARPDMVLLSLHGAMIAEHCGDCEGEILRRVRESVGPDVPVGVELDPHCHITDEMVEFADVIITYKEYPHTDIADIAEHLFDLIVRLRAGEIKPVPTVFDCRMINIWRTTFEPMRSFVSSLRSAEDEGDVLAISFAHGFPWGDVADMGAKLLIYTDNAPDTGDAVAARLFDEVWAIRDEAGLPCVSLNDALEKARTTRQEGDTRPAVIADVTDNPGGGAPGDNTDMLHAIILEGVENAALSPLWDPQAVKICFDAGEGAKISLRIGGKCGRASGAPLDLFVTVETLRRDVTQTLRGVNISMGDCALIKTGGIQIVLNSVRTQTLGLDAFSALGINPLDCDILFVKSMNHFAAEFGPIARALCYVTGAGALPVDFAAIPYVNLVRPMWPRVADPFGGERDG